MDGVITSIWVAITVACVLGAFAIGKDSAATECDNFGAFVANGNVIYKCERVSK